MVDYQTLSVTLTGIGMIIALTYYALVDYIMHEIDENIQRAKLQEASGSRKPIP